MFSALALAGPPGGGSRRREAGLAAVDQLHVLLADRRPEHDESGPRTCLPDGEREVVATRQRRVASRDGGRRDLPDRMARTRRCERPEDRGPEGTATCCEVLKSPDASPASSRATLMVAQSANGTNV